MRVVTYDFTVEDDDVGELDRRIGIHLGDILSEVEQVSIVDADEPDDFEQGGD